MTDQLLELFTLTMENCSTTIRGNFCTSCFTSRRNMAKASPCHLPSFHTIHSYSLKLSYEAVREFLADALEKVGVSLEKSSAGDSYRAHVVKAKAAHQDAENAVTNAQTKIEESNSNLSKDWGPEWEFKKLDCL
ncbi:hypothetical protein PPACK8108_LOCUS19586 [Phakopsora pachyrhizi]|uniref:Uncharacterized protein n=1 Tax=Phakopsora pachyrhizi TaxID=170000 RepID=A0AAV0BFW6_PHAPC|nr:hypothetical protein PPACK8108_LOCUS19586 [Phakopsora pachyrhizi]